MAIRSSYHHSHQLSTEYTHALGCVTMGQLHHEYAADCHNGQRPIAKLKSNAENHRDGMYVLVFYKENRLIRSKVLLVMRLWVSEGELGIDRWDRNGAGATGKRKVRG